MTQYYERKSQAIEVNDESGSPVKNNKYSKLQSVSMDSSPQQQANTDFELFQKYNDVAYLPEMKPIKVLGTIDDVGDPREHVYEIGPVIKPGNADYVNEKGGHDIVCYLTDFADQFPSLYHVGIGKLCPHISTEGDCESLFSQAGFMSHPQRAHTNICTYE